MKKYVMLLSLIFCFAFLPFGCDKDNTNIPDHSGDESVVDFSSAITEVKKYLLDNGLVFENAFLIEENPTSGTISITEEYVIDVDYLIDTFNLEFSCEGFSVSVTYNAPLVLFTIIQEK